MKGILNLEYALLRERRIDLKYRLRRRTYEVLKAIGKFYPNPQRILDLGTAEGRMLREVKTRHPSSVCIGVDYSRSLLGYGSKRFSGIGFVCADVQNLRSFKKEVFDVVIATAVIEHLFSPEKMLTESLRLLKKGGIIIITTPHPFWEKIVHVLGLLKGEHQSVMSSETILNLCRKAGFDILEYKGFMISPIGMMGELKIEEFIARTGLDKFLPNQLIVARK